MDPQDANNISARLYDRIYADPELVAFFKVPNRADLAKKMAEFLIGAATWTSEDYKKLRLVHRKVREEGADRRSFERVIEHARRVLEEAGVCDGVGAPILGALRSAEPFILEEDPGS